MRWIIRLALLLLVAVEAASAATAQSPAFTTFTESTQLGEAEIRVDVYVPSAASTQGVAILAHGFTGSRRRHRDLAQALASAGFIAVVPDLPDLLDARRNADAIVTLAHKLETGEASIPAVPRQRLVLIGTSFGGLVTVLAATRLPGLAGWIGLDPVDRARSGARAAAKLEAPAVVLLAEPSICNLYGNGSAIARAAPGLLRSTMVEGASHCDFEGPTTEVCRVACGRGAHGIQSVVREETVRAVAEMLRAPELRQTKDEPAVAD